MFDGQASRGQVSAVPRFQVLRLRNVWLQATAEAALSDNERVLSLKGAAEHIARRAPVTHPNMPENFLYTIEYIDLEELQREDDAGEYFEED